MQGAFDAAWHRRALEGEAEAVGRLSGVLSPLYRFCLYRLGRSRDLCEEVVQETLLRSLHELDRYEPERGQGNILPWLTGLARNEIQRVLARQRAGASWESLWARIDRDLQTAYAALDRQPLAEEVLQREETREMVNVAMSQLPARYNAAAKTKLMSSGACVGCPQGLVRRVEEAQRRPL